MSIQGKVSGLPVGKHGFHIHENKLKGTDCGTAGSHFNPEKVSSVLKKYYAVMLRLRIDQLRNKWSFVSKA